MYFGHKHLPIQRENTGNKLMEHLFTVTTHMGSKSMLDSQWRLKKDSDMVTRGVRAWGGVAG